MSNEFSSNKRANQFDKYMPFKSFEEVVEYMKSISEIDLADPNIHDTKEHKIFTLKMINCITRMEKLDLSNEEIEKFVKLYEGLVSDKNGVFNSTAIDENNKMFSFKYNISYDDAKKQGLPDYVLQAITILTMRKETSFRNSLKLLTNNSYCNPLLNDWYYANKFGPAFKWMSKNITRNL